ncbi:MAG: glycosyltransferase family 4 protein [Patescibacteria group bacterium]|jgi:glycogen(starch) synthase
MKTKRKLRVMYLLCFPLYGSGSGTYTRELAAEVSKSEDVAIVCPDNRSIPRCKLYEVHLPFFVAFTGHPEWPHCKLYHELTSLEIYQVYKSFLETTIRAVRDFKPNIIHVQHAHMLTWVARYMKAIYGINFIITTHGTGLLSTMHDRRSYHLTADAVRAAARITAVSADTRDWLFDIYGRYHSKKTRVIPGGIRIDQYPPYKPIRIINKKYDLTDKKVVFFSGKLTKPKGVKYLVHAAKWIKGEVFIVGGGEQLIHLQNLAAGLGLKNVHFLGYMGKEQMKELDEFYYRANVFVAPSVWDEPLGLVILESMAASTPVVVTRKGGIPLAVKDGYNGLFVRPRNAKDIAEKVNWLLEHDDARRKMGKNARKIVEEKFTWSTIAQTFIRIYHAFPSNLEDQKPDTATKKQMHFSGRKK